MPQKGLIHNKKAIFAVFALMVLIVGTLIFNSLFATVDKGTYQIKQAAISGTMSAHMKPGMYGLMFGSADTWPTAETYYFTHVKDTDDDTDDDKSIEVRFNDGSLADISGTVRIILPSGEQEAIDLVTVYSYRNYNSLRDKLILPVLRNALRNTANLMSARESYSDLRSNYIEWAWDQIQNGVYQTEEEERAVLENGEKITKKFKIIKKDKDGNILRGKNPLEGSGIRLANFEVKMFKYSGTVAKQIETQQKAYMGVATAVAKAKEAEQNAIKEKAEGEAKVMKARYEKEQEKIRAVVAAEQEKEVAELHAAKELEVARLEKQASAETKQKLILLGQGEATRKRLVMQADGALKQKLATYENVMAHWADAYSKRNVPTYQVTGGNGKTGGGDMQSNQFMNMLNTQMAKNLGLDLKVKK